MQFTNHLGIHGKKLDLSVEGALNISIINEVQLKSLRVLEMFYILRIIFY